MKKRPSSARIRLLAGALLCASAAAASAQDFDEARLRAGQAAYQSKRYIEAIDEFRVAAFGFLDKPVLLSECLVRLSLAQAAAGKTGEADVTLNRFLEVERGFGAYAKAKLEPEVRSEFRTLLIRQLGEPAIVGVPSLSGLVETEAQKMAKLAPGERRKAFEAAAKREPGAIEWPLALARDAMGRGDAKNAEKWATTALALDASNADALALRARARVARGDYADANRDLSALSEAEIQKRPELYAEKFVCVVEGQDWAAAEQVVGLVPAALAGRGDVAKAQQKLAAERQRRPGSE